MQGNCYQCHQDLGGYMFCPHCGTEQKCLSCGTAFQTEGRFCSECGVEKGKTGAEQVVGASVEQTEVRPVQQASQVLDQPTPVSKPTTPVQQPVSSPQHEVNEQPTSQQQQPDSEQQQQLNSVPSVNNQAQPSAQTKSRSQQVTASASQKKRKGPLFVVIAVLIGAAVAAYFFYFNNGTGAQTPEEAVKGFVEAMDDRDAEKIAPYIMPAVVDEVIDNINFNEIPKGTEIKLVRFGDIEYERDTMVEVEARLAIQIEGEEEVGTLRFELIQMKNKWYIVEVYD